MRESKRLSHSIVLLGMLVVLPARTSPGCQYNVRETGFVDLGTERYRLFCFANRETPRELVAAFERAAEKALDGSGVIHEVVLVDAPGEHPALRYLGGANVGSVPRLVLLSPGGQPRSVPAPAQSAAFRQALPAILSALVDSPLRRALVRQLAAAYGVVLLIEGAGAAENERAAGTASAAIGSIERQMKYMPKPIARGPLLATLKRDSYPHEAVLLWSLGLGQEPREGPRLAVLYGRGRWIGPVLEGNRITEKILGNILSVIGADCECGADPRLIRGTALPVRWDEGARAAVAAELGFDPENPLVIAEVSQIMKLHGSLYPWDAPSVRNKSAAADDLPIPFVQDRVRPKPPAPSPVPPGLLYVAAGAAGLVLLAGAVMIVRAAKKKP